MARTVMGLIDAGGEAERIVEELTTQCGCERNDIGLASREFREGAGRQVDEAGLGNTADSRGVRDVDDASNVSGVVKGAGAGLGVGGVLGAVLSMTSLAIPGIGPLIAAGPIVAALTGAGVGAAAGGLIGALTIAGVSKEDAHLYEEGVRRGGTLITVRADSEEAANCAGEVLRRHGAADIRARSEQWASAGSQSTGRGQSDERAAEVTGGVAPGSMGAAAAVGAAGAAEAPTQERRSAQDDTTLAPMGREDTRDEGLQTDLGDDSTRLNLSDERMRGRLGGDKMAGDVRDARTRGESTPMPMESTASGARMQDTGTETELAGLPRDSTGESVGGVSERDLSRSDPEETLPNERASGPAGSEVEDRKMRLSTEVGEIPSPDSVRMSGRGRSSAIDRNEGGNLSGERVARYTGPERRKSRAKYSGPERRAQP